MKEDTVQRCIYQCKDTNFKANHNLFAECEYAENVVFTNAKILILKLITTHRIYRYTLCRCIYQCKDTNFKANHNAAAHRNANVYVVFTNAKILILKLITTIGKHFRACLSLYLPMQRY